MRSDNEKPKYRLDSSKDDGIVASIMALDRCLRNEGEPREVFTMREDYWRFNKKARGQCLWQNVYYIKFAKFVQFAS